MKIFGTQYSTKSKFNIFQKKLDNGLKTEPNDIFYSFIHSIDILTINLVLETKNSLKC